MVIRAAALVCIALTSPGLAQPLRSPWPMPRPHPAETCATPPALPAVLDAADYYSDVSHSVIDPVRLRAYQDALWPLHAATTALERMADGQGGACAMRWLEAFATQGALTGHMGTNQAEYVRGWLLGAWATVALKAAPGRVPLPVAAWLAVLADEVRAYFAGRGGKVDGRNNHRNWAGFAVAAAGVAANRADLFAWGVDSARAGLRQVQDDGTLPLEMARRSRALHYHLFATAPLVLTAELAAANGIDLYAAPDAGGRAGALRRLAIRSLSGLDDLGFFAARAGAVQVDAAGDRPGNTAWASTFLARQPGAAPRPPAAGRSDLYSGGLPPEPASGRADPVQ